ncbi:MAG: nuclear transport factor 2 family protein [Muribaculaceae bacterium]|nr:nuclear transport factor 2 family protein [Muribaculaceae bacterium]
MSRRILLLWAVMLACAIGVRATDFSFAAGTAGAGVPRTTMERNTSKLLTEMRQAANEGRNLNLSGIDIQPRAAERLKGLWKSMHMRPMEASYTSRCLHDVQGYQARGLAVEMLPMSGKYEQATIRELTLSYNRKGQITGVRPAMENKQIAGNIMRKGASVSEAAERTEILKFVEDLSSYYNEKDTASLNAIYSDDALIITGSVIKRQVTGDGGPRYIKDVRYVVRTKAEYLRRLKEQFRRNKHIKVEFSDISVVSHPAKDHIYSVTLYQKYSTDTYHDEGYLFLVWDFSEPDHPRISVRNWQDPEYTKMNGLPTLADFFWP